MKNLSRAFDDDLRNRHMELARMLHDIERDIECLPLPACVVETLHKKAREYRSLLDAIGTEMYRRGDCPCPDNLDDFGG